MNIRGVLGSPKFIRRWASLFAVFFLLMSLAGAGCDTPNQIQVPQQTAAQQTERIDIVDSEAVQPLPTAHIQTSTGMKCQAPMRRHQSQPAHRHNAVMEYTVSAKAGGEPVRIMAG